MSRPPVTQEQRRRQARVRTLAAGVGLKASHHPQGWIVTGPDGVVGYLTDADAEQFLSERTLAANIADGRIAMLEGGCPCGGQCTCRA
jgi:hypothetical protein